ncbi:MAG: hypothetical protein ACKVQJ_15345 [Pyrinomonadaceae bacterium]
MLNIIRQTIVVFSLIGGLAAVMYAAGDIAPRKAKRVQETVKIRAVPWGPTETQVNRAKRRVERDPDLQKFLKDTRYRLVNFEYVDTDGAVQQAPSRFRVYFYDYTNDRTIIAEGDFAAMEPLTIREEYFDPGVADEELTAAFELIKNGAEFGPLYKSNELKIGDAMPAISNLNGERLVNISLKYADGRREIVGISFKNNKIIHYPDNAPTDSRAAPQSCGIPSAGQESTANGTPGQFSLVVTRGITTLWEMTVIRPSASSGNEGERSGIEIRDVKYRGKSVLKRAHAPILNVKYAAGVQCGPYRDWQYQEGMFDAPSTNATDVADGVRILANGQIATTAVESGNDTGNFRGVAIYRQGTDTVLVSEMNAGWYRYVMEWRFDDDGTIRPRYGFGATDNSCVCFNHYHHVYWRFDFDIVTPANTIFQVKDSNSAPRYPISNEVALRREDLGPTRRSFMIKNSAGREAYILVPSKLDGNWSDGDPVYGQGDFWFLKFQGTPASPDELNDPNTSTAANLAPWVNNESLVGQDIVIWYAAHFSHIDGANRFDPDHRSPNILSGDHVVGPDIKPVRW